MNEGRLCQTRRGVKALPVSQSLLPHAFVSNNKLAALQALYGTHKVEAAGNEP